MAQCIDTCNSKGCECDTAFLYIEVQIFGCVSCTYTYCIHTLAVSVGIFFHLYNMYIRVLIIGMQVTVRIIVITNYLVCSIQLEECFTIMQYPYLLSYVHVYTCTHLSLNNPDERAYQICMCMQGFIQGWNLGFPPPRSICMYNYSSPRMLTNTVRCIMKQLYHKTNND